MTSGRGRARWRERNGSNRLRRGRGRGYSDQRRPSGTWTKVVATPVAPEAEEEITRTPRRDWNLHPPQSPGAWLLSPKRHHFFSTGAQKAPTIEGLVRSHSGKGAADHLAPQRIVAFCDGTETSHVA